MKHVIETGHAPDISKLAALAHLSQPETEDGLNELARMHGVILVPNSLGSLEPAPLRADAHTILGHRKTRRLVGQLRLVFTGHRRCAANRHHHFHGRRRRRRAAGNSHRTRPRLAPGLLMHFPYPPARWWDNPYCPCGNILFFSSAEKIDSWCTRHNRPRGAVLTMETGIALAQEWFGDYASPDWRRKTPIRPAPSSRN